MKMPGRLYVFEGVDAVGKTSIASRLFEHLRNDGAEVEMFAYPGKADGSLGKHVYTLHHSPETFGIRNIDALSLQVLHIAAHIDGLSKNILPALDAGKTVILDRFWWSTKIYGEHSGVNVDALECLLEAERISWRGRVPDKIVLIRTEVPLRTSTDVGWEKLRGAYDELARTLQQEGNVHVISNTGTIEDALLNVLGAIRH